MPFVKILLILILLIPSAYLMLAAAEDLFNDVVRHQRAERAAAKEATGRDRFRVLRR